MQPSGLFGVSAAIFEADWIKAERNGEHKHPSRPVPNDAFDFVLFV